MCKLFKTTKSSFGSITPALASCATRSTAKISGRLPTLNTYDNNNDDISRYGTPRVAYASIEKAAAFPASEYISTMCTPAAMRNVNGHHIL
ncbi:hypothetical protein CP863_06450 [Cutibacterium acnes]|uniref:Uncharacterized protein n=2 Tax=Cutibacterium acnes TaxID=1747 RepID=A0AAD0QNL4_CUTAC|nr:hypothetical protein PPA0867 [Cutibacterium acnes KPA171202]AXM06280.1 hypothetical protein DXN06_03255 [Cutibacterium acnes]EFT77545.1 hypothetical protein HMPREF9601_02032 [Cutibacterium acnes HL030PA1]PGF31165.1 hypothetical protein B1B10_12785 [Cutibacterium acnes subsp. acnes]PGF31438.1 hypothetical protein B1B11_12725 [Cutibacterium acnes subsp. acnes]